MISTNFYKLEVPQNCQPRVFVRRGDKYSAKLFRTTAHGRMFDFYVPLSGWHYTSEFNSEHLSGGDWIVHEY